MDLLVKYTINCRVACLACDGIAVTTTGRFPVISLFSRLSSHVNKHQKTVTQATVFGI